MSNTHTTAEETTLVNEDELIADVKRLLDKKRASDEKQKNIDEIQLRLKEVEEERIATQKRIEMYNMSMAKLSELRDACNKRIEAGLDRIGKGETFTEEELISYKQQQMQRLKELLEIVPDSMKDSLQKFIILKLEDGDIGDNKTRH